MAYRSSPHAGTSNGGAGGFLVEQQNDDMVEELSSKVSQLKRVTIAIGDDVREQNKLLNEMETKFDSTRGLLGATMKKLGIVSKAGGKNVMCYLVLFAFFVFLVIYWLMR
uniref:t-SNARE coiled-coil homology domain-containing protein n=1 Tax=Globodera rostochiensis TaxID=31243 RepID=A0A914IC41_GLORO